MKIVAAILVTLAIIALTQADIIATKEQKDKINKLRNECIEELEIDEQILERPKDGDFQDDPKFKEFLYCMAKKTGFQNEDGEIQKDLIIQSLGDAIQNSDKAKEAVEKCFSGSGLDPAYNIAKCLYDSYPEYVTQYF